MEELLHKNIFRESDLLKHAPDYNSQDIYLRLQHRRDMAKETQKHRQKTNQRKAKLQHKKNYNNSYYKINTEIAKVHSLFRNTDANNQLILKNCKKLNKFSSFMKCDNNESKLLEKEMCTYVEKSQEIPDLSIENESEFKLLPKWRHTNIRVYGKEAFKNENDIDEHLHESNDNSLISKYKIKKIKDVESTYHTKNLIQFNDSFKSDDSKDYAKDDDLQSLLIMMTVSNYNEIIYDQNYDEEQSNSSLKDNVYPQNNTAQISETITSTQEDNDICGILKIKPFKREEVRKRYIVKKYLQKWKTYVRTKTENMINHQRHQKLHMFLDKLNRAKNTANETDGPINKAKVLVRDYNSYQHRYKVQKNIIALQKAKLEQQNKLIEELKYNKIIEASRQSLDFMKDEVRKTYYEIDKHLKPKIKLLTNELNIKEIEEPSLVLHCLKVPQFLQRMEARAREREEKHAVIRERRKQMEEEKIRVKQQAEIEKAEMDKEEKLKRMKELKEKRKKEKIENIRRKQHAERIRALTVMADLHYEKNLMIKYGLRPFHRLVQMKRDNIDKARAHYKFQLMKNVFLNWMFYTEDMWFERNYKADEFYRKKLLTLVFGGLKQNHHNFILRKQVAEDYYDLYVMQLAFRKFRDCVKIMKEEVSAKWSKAVNYHNCNLLFKTFTCWRTLPALNGLKREQEARKLKWRQKVLQVVPDYKPPDD